VLVGDVRQAQAESLPLVSAFLFSVALQAYDSASSFERAACNPGAHAGRRTDDGNGLLHLHYPAGLLVGGRVQSSWHQEHGTSDRAVKEAASRAKIRKRNDDDFKVA
jgi:hypothetical protein